MKIVGKILKVVSIIGMVVVGIYFLFVTINYSNVYNAFYRSAFGWSAPPASPNFFTWLIHVFVPCVASAFSCVVSYFLGVLFVDNAPN